MFTNLELPEPAAFGVDDENGTCCNKVYVGGEKQALENLESRLLVESAAFRVHSYLPNRRDPDILSPPKSLSPDLRFGALSIRKFYWSVMDTYIVVQNLGVEEGVSVHLI